MISGLTSWIELPLTFVDKLDMKQQVLLHTHTVCGTPNRGCCLGILSGDFLSFYPRPIAVFAGGGKLRKSSEVASASGGQLSQIFDFVLVVAAVSGRPDWHD
jgi:hypothetical protein